MNLSYFVGSLHFEPGSWDSCCSPLPALFPWSVCPIKEKGLFDLAPTPTDWLRDSQARQAFLVHCPCRLHYSSLERISRAMETLVINVTQIGRVIREPTFSGGQFGNAPEVLNMFIPFHLVILLLGIYLKKRKICIQFMYKMFITAVFIRKIGNQPIICLMMILLSVRMVS